MRELPEYRKSTQLGLQRKKSLSDEMIFMGEIILFNMIILPIIFLVVLPMVDKLVLPPALVWCLEIFFLVYLLLLYIDGVKVSKGFSVYEIQVVDKTGTLYDEDDGARVKDIDGKWLYVDTKYAFTHLQVGGTYKVIISRSTIKSLYEE